MEISIIAEFKAYDGREFLAASAKGNYLGEKFDRNTYYRVKVAKGAWNTFIQSEGIFKVEVEDAWIDTRDSTKFPTCWVKNITKVEKKAELKKKA